MEITSFILGVLAVIALAMVAITSVNYMTTKYLKQQVTELQHVLDKRTDDLYTIINKFGDDAYSRIDTVEQNVVRHADSRVDRLENKIYSDFDIKRQQSRQY